GRRPVGRRGRNAQLEIVGAVYARRDSFPVSSHFPGIGVEQPVVGPLDLATLHDFLPKDAVLVPKTVSHRRDASRSKRVHEAGGEPPEPSIAERGFRLLLDQPLEIESFASDERVHLSLETQARDMALQRSAWQILEREIVDPLGAGARVGALRREPSRRQPVPNRMSERREALTIARLPGVEHGIEAQMPNVSCVQCFEQMRTAFRLSVRAHTWRFLPVLSRSTWPCSPRIGGLGLPYTRSRDLSLCLNPILQLMAGGESAPLRAIVRGFGDHRVPLREIVPACWCGVALSVSPAQLFQHRIFSVKRWCGWRCAHRRTSSFYLDARPRGS